MTRINLIDVEELSDQNLLAEYRELPRCIKQDFDLSDAPKQYTLGKGHMKWAAQYPGFLIGRYYQICNELVYRGFKLKYTCRQLIDYVYNHKFNLLLSMPGYRISWEDEILSRNRIIERYKANPAAHKWTRREKPIYLAIL